MGEKESKMKKLIVLAVMAAISAMVLSGCSKRVSVMGYECYSENPFDPCKEPPASEDYTHGIAPAIADSMTPSDNNGDGNSDNNDDKEIAKIKRYEFQNGSVNNPSNRNIMVEFRIARFPGNIDAQQLMARTGVYNMPGYAMLSVEVTRRSAVEITLKPGDYDVTVYWLQSSGKIHKLNDKLHVDVRPGRHKSGDKTYDFIYYY